MDPIHKGGGINASEKYLADLADRSFLNLWSYPNVYNDKRSTPGGIGKELCDLLVVCGDHILIFSCKEIAWPESGDVSLSWRRWYKRAIEQSVKQVRGAERWLESFPDRIFIDPRCTQRLPIRLPSPESRKVHRIVVALGASEACKHFFGAGSGSFIFNPFIHGAAHVEEGARPFVIGDVDPSGSFVHVLNDATLRIVMSEADTITDFTNYLSKKEAASRAGHLGPTAGEEELLAYFVTHINGSGEHEFTRPNGDALELGEVLVIEEGSYSALLSDQQYKAKKLADKASYVWDRLIEAFTNNLLAGQTIVQDGFPSDLADVEEGVRYMALVPRFQRRGMSLGILDALETGKDHSRFVRAFLPGPTEANRETGFFFMTLALPSIALPGGYDDYRLVRMRSLQTYALNLLRQYPNLKRVIGIATEPPPKPGQAGGSSEDLIMAEQPTWSDDLIRNLEKDTQLFDVMQAGRYKEYEIHETEYPNLH